MKSLKRSLDLAAVVWKRSRILLTEVSEPHKLRTVNTKHEKPLRLISDVCSERKQEEKMHFNQGKEHTNYL